MTNSETHKPLNEIVHEVAATCNIVIAQKINNPGSAGHEEAMKRLTNVLTKRPDAFDTLIELQKGE